MSFQRAFADLSEALWSGVLWLAGSWRPSRWEAGLVGHRCDCRFDPHIHRLAHKQLHSNVIHLDFQSQVKEYWTMQICVCPRLFVLLFCFCFFQNFLTRLEINQKKHLLCQLTFEIVKLERLKVKASSCKEILCLYTFAFSYLEHSSCKVMLPVQVYFEADLLWNSIYIFYLPLLIWSVSCSFWVDISLDWDGSQVRPNTEWHYRTARTYCRPDTELIWQ